MRSFSLLLKNKAYYDIKINIMAMEYYIIILEILYIMAHLKKIKKKVMEKNIIYMEI